MQKFPWFSLFSLKVPTLLKIRTLLLSILAFAKKNIELWKSIIAMILRLFGTWWQLPRALRHVWRFLRSVWWVFWNLVFFHDYLYQIDTFLLGIDGYWTQGNRTLVFVLHAPWGCVLFWFLMVLILGRIGLTTLEWFVDINLELRDFRGNKVPNFPWFWDF